MSVYEMLSTPGPIHNALGYAIIGGGSVIAVTLVFFLTVLPVLLGIKVIKAVRKVLTRGTEG